MMLNFDKEIAEIMAVKGDQPGGVMEIMFVLAGVIDRGMGMERERTIKILQQHAVNAQDLIREIRKPIR